MIVRDGSGKLFIHPYRMTRNGSVVRDRKAWVVWVRHEGTGMYQIKPSRFRIVALIRGWLATL